ncbi:MAG: glycosyltransferase [Bacteroidales bacterium]|jgi:hypothetical protein|nr:glycosyltransferase [Bacteroidales bacterium]
MEKKVIVISFVNLSAKVGGAYTILKECLTSLIDNNLDKDYKIITVLNSKEVSPFENIECIELPLSKKSWLFRIYYEYFYFRRLSKKLKPFLWLSLHDMTPNVKAERQAVYMHNPSVFYKWKWSDLFVDWKIILFASFYKYAYRINVHRNDFLIVQQSWLRDSFSRMLNVDKRKIVVSRPQNNALQNMTDLPKSDNIVRFLYVSVPRIYKNFEVICEAVKILNEKSVGGFEVNLSLAASPDNKYATMIYNKYHNVGNINFLGLLLKDDLLHQYARTDCLIFASKLETWGLSISEFAAYHKPVLLADLPYAHESSAGCMQTAFFAPDNSAELASLMENIIVKDYSNLHPTDKLRISEPFASSWSDLWKILLK